MSTKKKVITIEVKTKLNNDDLRNIVKNRLSDEAIEVVQVQVNLIKSEKK